MANRRKSRSQNKPTHNSNSIRIIGGDWRGRKLSFPSAEGLRPTGDRMRETLFNWLAPEIGGAQVIDLFAGSGSLGLESLSRGAAHATFIETNPMAAKAIEENLGLLECTSASVKQLQADSYVQSLAPNLFDILFLDPPFAENLHSEILALINSSQIMKPGAGLYIEAPVSASVAIPASWSVHRKKVSGQVNHLLCRC